MSAVVGWQIAVDFGVTMSGAPAALDAMASCCKGHRNKSEAVQGDYLLAGDEAGNPDAEVMARPA